MSKQKAYWEEIFSCYKASGLSQPEFCKQNNLSNNQFQYRWYERNKALKAQALSVERFETVSVASNATTSTPVSTVIHLSNKIQCDVVVTLKDLAPFLAQLVQLC